MIDDYVAQNNTENQSSIAQIVNRLTKVNGKMEIKCSRDKSDPTKTVNLVFVKIGVMSHRKSLVQENVQKFKEVSLSEGRIVLEEPEEGQLTLVGIIRPKSPDNLLHVTNGLIKKMFICIFKSANDEDIDA